MRVRSLEAQGAVAWRCIEGEDLARRSAARLLITAPSSYAVEVIARRVHAASMRADCPIVCTRAGELPSDPAMLKATCASLLDAAAGGTLLITDIETMLAPVQNCFIEVIEELERGRDPAAAVRLVTATTVFLYDRVATHRFSERLFYRLNILHVIAEDDTWAVGAHESRVIEASARPGVARFHETRWPSRPLGIGTKH
jgi:DNA-binding NtrC family response regulator